MKPSRATTLSLLLSGSALLASHASAQTTITGWNFNNNYVAPVSPQTIDVDTTPAPSTGSGTASSLGMNQAYNGTTTTDVSDINNSTPNDPSDPSGSNYQWRIRGGTIASGVYTNTAATNGWSSNAPIGSQGAQFLASTVGYTGVQVSFDWSPTAQGEANLQVLYTLNGSNYFNVPASLFTVPSTVTVSTNTTSANTVLGGYIQTLNSTTYNSGIVVNLSSIAGASNDPNFGIELVNASTGADDISTKATALNNTSGNWRFDEVNIEGTSMTAAPEPSTYAIVLASALGLFVVNRRLRRKHA